MSEHITQGRRFCFCDVYIDNAIDAFAGTYCKLPAGHAGEHSPHYPPDDTPRRFAHNCDHRCVFLGQTPAYDVYACPNNGDPLVCMRYGNAKNKRIAGLELLGPLPKSMRDKATALIDSWRLR